jgi:hypothetical protein
MIRIRIRNWVGIGIRNRVGIGIRNHVGIVLSYRPPGYIGWLNSFLIIDFWCSKTRLKIQAPYL